MTSQKRKLELEDEHDHHRLSVYEPPAKRPSPSPQSQPTDEEPQESYFRNLYATEPDFAKLGQQFPEFGAHLKPSPTGGPPTLNFQHPPSLISLTQTLLAAHFKLPHLSLPPDRLCPPVPIRHTYILFLKLLLDTSTYHPRPSTIPRVGLDIGTGSSCIYPLLGCSQRSGWKFLATDVDETNLEYARKNVVENEMEGRVKVVGPRNPDGPMIPILDHARKVPPAALGREEENNIMVGRNIFGQPTDLQPEGKDGEEVGYLDFLMVNPPFYSSTLDLLSSAQSKSEPPFSACTGAPVEMVCPGGETAFISRVITESFLLKRQVGWYTCMLGKLESVEHVVAQLRGGGGREGVDNWVVVEFVGQGPGRGSSSSGGTGGSGSSRTKRWGVAWSFGGMRPGPELVQGCWAVRTVAGKKVAPWRVEEEVLRVVGLEGRDGLVEGLEPTIWELELLEWGVVRRAGDVGSGSTGDGNRVVVFEGVGRTMENVWSRAWRRKKMRGEVDAMERRDMPSQGDCTFGFSVFVVEDEGDVVVKVRWREGHDHVIYESFCGYLKRKLEDICSDGKEAQL